MFDAISGALGHFMTVQVLLYLVLGATIGAIIGAIPGLGGIFALSILLPFAYPMDVYSGIAFLLGAHAVINTGGSVTAILYGAPGAAGNAATVFDGYPLTQQGQAGRAIGAALSASCFGGIFGAILLFVMIPIIKPIVLMFQSPEFFMLCILGVTMIAIVSTGSILKSLMVGFAGLLLSTVGLDPTYGAVRYTFGSLYLWDGLSLIPVVIGLFAIAEMLDITAIGASAISEKKQKVQNIFSGFVDTIRNWKVVVQGGIIGAFFGAIPGIGGETLNFIAYGLAKSFSKNAHFFGNGAIEGVIAPESANNAKEGGVLLPTLAFGIPGAASMAVLLGAFQIWGIQPGPKMLTENLSIVYMMIATLVVGNIIGAVVSLFISIYAVRLTNVRSSLLVPGIIAVSFVASFSYASHISDIIIALVFGIIGFFMKKFDYSRAVFLIGLVLGIKAEAYLNLSIRIYSYEFLLRPSVIIILVINLLILLMPFIKKKVRNKRTIEVME